VLGRQARSGSRTFHPELAGDLRVHQLFLRRGELMSGHSKWHSIKHKKGAADARAASCSRSSIRQIEVAARAAAATRGERDAAHDGPEGARQLGAARHDPARDQAGTGEEEGVTYEQVSYEGYARTASPCTCRRSPTTATARGRDQEHLQPQRRSFAEPGAVSWQFERKGIVVLDKSARRGRAHAAPRRRRRRGHAGLGDTWQVTTPPTELHAVRTAIERRASR
jgi:transcriptional/translational regulatory protein YebC/TACO1